MISQLDELLQPFGLCAPIRFTLTLNLVKIKLANPIDGKKLTLKILVSNDEKKIDILPSDRVFSRTAQMESQEEFCYGINK